MLVHYELDCPMPPEPRTGTVDVCDYGLLQCADEDEYIVEQIELETAYSSFEWWA